MAKKPRRRRIYYSAFTYSDGAAVSCVPWPQPTAKQIKDRDMYVDEDFLCREHRYKASDFVSLEPELAPRYSDILTNRLNTRRAIRELVLPEIAALAATLQRIEKRLEAIERSVGDGEAS
ncbi:hypothetical protein CA13_62310 [Planctomycetes bacterium CA13]|uniref:Uncharacterized protein n=1 Tax=Novipirellula herctigrandis TaxID=2527986 RepID=A0A5C5ZD60_9BACT|nr:hypothetical protein CA13_62310 [Planctomycetes bacterium CA13]